MSISSVGGPGFDPKPLPPAAAAPSTGQQPQGAVPQNAHGAPKAPDSPELQAPPITHLSVAAQLAMVQAQSMVPNPTYGPGGLGIDAVEAESRAIAGPQLGQMSVDVSA